VPSSIDDLVNALMTQVERVRDVPHRHAERMKPSDGLVVRHTLTLRVELQPDELIPDSTRFAHERVIRLHAVYRTRQYGLCLL
jgi:hypothetical protein